MNHKIILFDGVCNFCNFWVNFIIDRDKKDKFRFAALQSEAGQEYLKKFNLSTKDFDTFVLIYHEKYFTRSTAGLLVLKELSSPLKLFYLFIIIPSPLRNFIYDLAAKYRYKFFGKRKSCRIPAPQEKAKFIL